MSPTEIMLEIAKAVREAEPAPGEWQVTRVEQILEGIAKAIEKRAFEIDYEGL